MKHSSLILFTLPFAAILFGGNIKSHAQCAKEDCFSLGYTESENLSNKCIKCPFGEAWNCPISYACPSEYLYKCVGERGYINGEGEECNGKFKSCKCSRGYVWTGSSCKLRCEAGHELGYILYSDMTRSAELDNTKTPIGIVVCSYLEGGGQAMSLNSIGKYFAGIAYSDSYITKIPHKRYSTSLSAALDTASCENSNIIMTAGDSSIFPAVWAVHEYKTEGTNAGDWCLPAAGIFVSYYYNQDVINSGFEKTGGTIIDDSTNTWASTINEADSFFITYFTSTYNGVYDGYGPSNPVDIRPVITF